MKDKFQSRALANKTEKFQPKRQLHKYFFEFVKKRGDKSALYRAAGDAIDAISYKSLAALSLGYAEELIKQGAKQGDRVVVMLPRSFRQIAAVIGVLSAGCTYIPVNVSVPQQRFESICNSANVKFTIAGEGGDIDFAKTRLINSDKVTEGAMEPLFADESSPAYIIFTSGSTGTPKGVVISHDAACNTIDDVNEKFNITESDVAIGISSLEFDLSVYDIFGMLSVGGSLAIVEDSQVKEPLEWLDIIKLANVTVWNSVPALFSMMLMANGEKQLPLKKIMLSGDWIDTTIPSRAKAVTQDADIIAMGGATEASIWSNYFLANDAQSSWQSIPYGKPLANQKFRVVDKNGIDCDDEVEGELLIGGRGVALEYAGNPELTAKSFFEEDGVRWYHTGDLGKYREDGNIIFCGRMDSQMKINGYRVEAGEIETVAQEIQGVEKALALAIDSATGKQLKLGIKIPPRSRIADSFKKTGAKEVSSDFQSDEIERQALIVERFLVELIVDNASDDKLKLIPTCADAALLMSKWTGWLVDRGVFKRENGELYRGARMSDAAGSARGGDYFEKALYENINLYREILAGERQASELLNEPALSPEVMAASAAEARDVIGVVGSILEGSSAKRAAVIDARTGEILQLLCNVYSAEYTAFEPSLAMRTALREKCGELPVSLAEQNALINTLTTDYYQKFDAVIMLYNLHRYAEPVQELSWLRLLLNEGGELIVVDMPDLQPFAIVTSMMLEYGFTNLPENVFSPMRDSGDWAEVILDAGYADVTVHKLDKAFSYVISARKQTADVSIEAIEAHIGNKLAAHMLPSEIAVLRRIPLTSNGKVDRKEAALWFADSSAAMKGAAPETKEERELAEIWSAFFGVENIGVENSFFEMGADSLAATRLLVLLKEKYGVEFSMRELFENSQLKLMAELIQQKNSIEMEEGEL